MHKVAHLKSVTALSIALSVAQLEHYTDTEDVVVGPIAYECNPLHYSVTDRGPWSTVMKLQRNYRI
jgi:hypothetical protein